MNQNTKSYVPGTEKHLGNRNKKERKTDRGGEKIRDSMELETLRKDRYHVGDMFIWKLEWMETGCGACFRKDIHMQQK